MTERATLLNGETEAERAARRAMLIRYGAEIAAALRARAAEDKS